MVIVKSVPFPRTKRVCLQRMDLGDCPKIHDLALRADFEAASKGRDYYYDIDVSPEITLLIYVLFMVE